MNWTKAAARRQVAAMVPALILASFVAAHTSTAQAASSSTVVINELMYNPLSDLDTDEFLELANTGATAVDMSGWTFGGVTATLPAGTSIPAHGFFVLAPDATRYQLLYGSAPNAIYTGKLSNGGETITVTDATATLVDSVTYSDTAGWPVTPDGLGPSLELIDPSLDHNDPLNWAASTNAKGNTAGAANSVAHVGSSPRIDGLTATPAVPTANQAVTVTATITGNTSQSLFYRVDFGSEVSVPFTSGGGGAYSAVLPGVAAGHLLRYRVQAANSVGTTKSPRVDDTIIYQGVEAQSGVTSALPVLDWFITDADYNQMVNNPLQDIVKPCVVAYGGVVYDNATVNIRGKISRTNPKVSWTFDIPHNHDLDMPGVIVEPVDTFAMEANWTDHSHGRQILSYDSYGEANVLHNEAFPMRTQKNAKFLGLYIYIDIFDGTWRDREGYSNDQFFKAENAAYDPTKSDTFRFTKENPKDTDYSPVINFANSISTLTGTAQRNFLLANGDIPELINFAAATAIVQHVDSAAHNFYLSEDPTRGRWTEIPWDLDKTFGLTCCGDNSPFVTPAEPADASTSPLMRALLAQPDWKAMYFRRLKTLVDQILVPGHLEAEYDAALGPAQPEAALDLANWPTQASWNYTTQRTSLFKALTTRRAAFANDSRVPAAQSASPNIVINEIQHTPLGGGNAEFFELYNPSATEAVDLSGWSVADAVNLTIEPGTVILPHGFMVFAANDPTFRSTYGSTVFVGGVYSGGLSSAETITLKRADGSTDDQVAYGGAGWPLVTAGQSLELIDPSSDNNVGSNWALSANAGGSPGAPNGTGTVNSPPTAAFTSSCSGLTCTFNGTGSTDTDGTITSYAWTFGDGGTTTGATPSHTYGSVATFPVTLKVTDNGGATNSITQNVTTTTTTTPIGFVGAAHGPLGSVKSEQVTVPAAAQAGNTALLFFTTSTSSPWTGPTGVTGWTQLSTFTQGTTTSTLWTKTLASGDVGKGVRFDSTAYHKGILDLAVYSGASAATPVFAHAGDTGKAAHVTPSVTAPAGAWVVSLWADKSETTTGWTAPAGVTSRDVGLGTGSGRFTSLLADTGSPVAGGATSALTATTNANGSYGDMWTVALAPTG